MYIKRVQSLLWVLIFDYCSRAIFFIYLVHTNRASEPTQFQNALHINRVRSIRNVLPLSTRRQWMTVLLILFIDLFIYWIVVVVLDRYVTGTPTRHSPHWPVPGHQAVEAVFAWRDARARRHRQPPVLGRRAAIDFRDFQQDENTFPWKIKVRGFGLDSAAGDGERVTFKDENTNSFFGH